MGTLEFTAKFSGMRKAQDFIVYPKDKSGPYIFIQSDTRFGQLNLESGELFISTPKPNGAGHAWLQRDMIYDRHTREVLTPDELKAMRAGIKGTGGLEVGSCGMVSDNTGALEL